MLIYFTQLCGLSTPPHLTFACPQANILAQKLNFYKIVTTSVRDLKLQIIS